MSSKMNVDDLLACVGLELEEANSVLRRHIVYILLLSDLLLDPLRLRDGY